MIFLFEGMNVFVVLPEFCIVHFAVLEPFFAKFGFWVKSQNIFLEIDIFCRRIFEIADFINVPN
jgi:hypothetical protein